MLLTAVKGNAAGERTRQKADTMKLLQVLSLTVR
jgi:hypothetical protein